MQHLKTKWLVAKINNFTGLFIARSAFISRSSCNEEIKCNLTDWLHSSPSFTNKTKIWVWLKAIIVFILLVEAFTVWFADQPTDKFFFFLFIIPFLAFRVFLPRRRVYSRDIATQTNTCLSIVALVVDDVVISACTNWTVKTARGGKCKHEEDCFGGIIKLELFMRKGIPESSRWHHVVGRSSIDWLLVFLITSNYQITILLYDKRPSDCAMYHILSTMYEFKFNFSLLNQAAERSKNNKNRFHKSLEERYAWWIR